MRFYIIFIFLLLIACRQNDIKGCPLCTQEMQEIGPVLPDSEDALGIEMKWVGLQGSPSLENPSLVCEDSFQDVLFRRHVRANLCVWTPQCKVILTPVFQASTNYAMLPDTDTSVGEEGDVVIHLDENNQWAYSDEMIELITAADNHWNQKENGITAIAIRRFIDSDGNQLHIRGFGSYNGGVRPFIIVVDHEFLPTAGQNANQNTERVLAHEIGHALNLCHVDENGCNQENNGNIINNLMNTTGSSTWRQLLASQCEVSRSVNPVLFNNSGMQGIKTRKNPIEGKATDLLATLDKNNRNMTFQILNTSTDTPIYLGIDFDGNQNTGISIAQFPDRDTRGYEAYIEILPNRPLNERALLYVQRGNQASIETSAIGSITFNEVNNYGFAFTDEGCKSSVIGKKMTINIPEHVLELIDPSFESTELLEVELVQ